MTRPGIAMIVGLVAAALAASGALPGSSADAHRRDHRLQFLEARAKAYEAAYNELLGGLDRVERLNERRRTRGVKRRIRKVLANTRYRAGALLEATDAPHGDAIVVAPVEQPRDVYVETAAPMAPADFRALHRAVDDASFAKEQLRLVEAACAHNWFSVDQVVTLVGLASFGDTRVEIAAMMYPRVVDLRGWYRVYDALDFDSSRTKLRKRIHAYQR